MNRGKWYFVYSWRTYGGTWEDMEIPLNATTEDEAIAEAKPKWDEKVVEAKANWEAKRGWGHPPASPFTDGPTDPRVIYKISLQ